MIAGDKVKVDDAETLSENPDIGKPTVKKYTATEGEIILDIVVKGPVTMTLEEETHQCGCWVTIQIKT